MNDEGETEIIERRSKAVFSGLFQALALNWRILVTAIFIGGGFIKTEFDAHKTVWSEAGSNLEKKTEAISDLQNRVEMLESNVNQLKGSK